MRLLREWAPYLAALAVAVYGFYLSEEARDGTCLSLEGQHKVDVEQLGRTYDFLATQGPADFRPAAKNYDLNLAITRGLKSQEARAHSDTAPTFCDSGSWFHGELGLPEPDPTVPRRPAELKALPLPKLALPL